jgi:hypothetical protein
MKRKWQVEAIAAISKMKCMCWLLLWILLYYLRRDSKPMCDLVVTASLILRHVPQRAHYNGNHQSEKLVLELIFNIVSKAPIF